MDSIPINWGLVANPLNWAIIVLMLLIAAYVGHLVIPSTVNSPSS